MNTHLIENDLVKYLLEKNNKFVIPTTYMYEWESDIFCVSRSDYVVEYEIKVSKSDFKADLKKEKHLHLSGKGNIRENYAGLTFTEEELMKEPGMEKVETHKYGWKTFKRYYLNIPNRFYYVMPENLVNVDQIPDHAGLIYFSQKNGLNYFNEIKKAPVVSKEKMKNKEWESLAMKFFYRWNNEISENRNFRYRADRAEKEVRELREKLKQSKKQLNIFEVVS